MPMLGSGKPSVPPRFSTLYSGIRIEPNSLCTTLYVAGRLYSTNSASVSFLRLKLECYWPGDWLSKGGRRRSG